jgi:hypothetical protein
MGGEVESIYKIEQLPNGFIVTGEGRVTTKVKLSEDKMRFEVGHTRNRYDENNVGLIEGRALITKAAGCLMKDWTPVKKNKNGFVPPKLKNWVIGRTGRALAKRIKAERLRLIEKADPKVLAIQKAVFAASGQAPLELFDPYLYEKNKYYLQDIIKFPAAAMTVLDRITAGHSGYVNKDVIVNNDWKQLYVSRGKEVYTSLNKTLMNLPGGVPISILANFPKVHLERPIYSRRELVFTLSCSGHHEWHRNEGNSGITKEIRHLLMNVSADEVTRSAKKLSEHMRTPFNLRKAYEVHRLALYIMDAAPHITHNGNLVGLMEKAIEYHRQASWNNCGVPPDTLTAVPPIPLPANKGVVFLKNVREVVEEGQNQHHCIGSYAKTAVNGTYYLFHIIHKGQSASVQVGATTGTVVQAYGPYNSTNEASKWGKSILGKWASKLPLSTTKVVASLIDPYGLMQNIVDDYDNVPF